MGKNTSIIQETGQVTLPIEFRRKYGLKKGDVVVFTETEYGLLVTTREALVNSLLDEIGNALKAKGITLEELIESGREIRGEIVREKYGLDVPDDD